MCNCCCGKIPEPIQFAVGDNEELTPSAGSNTYKNKEMKYLKYLVFRNGEGYLHETIDYIRLPQGGFQLAGTDVFDALEKFTITFYN
jgi:hypothetical protein